MSKRNPVKASKHARSPKIAAKAQRSAQEVVRSPKHPHPGEATSTAPKSRKGAASQEAGLAENGATVAREIVDTAKAGTFFPSATANLRAYQAMLLEIAQANMNFAFEFAQRLATTRSPIGLPIVIAEFTSKRVAMFRKHSKELSELSTKR